MEDVRVSLRVDGHTGNLPQSDAVQVRPLFDLANLCNTMRSESPKKGEYAHGMRTGSSNQVIKFD